MSMRLQEHRGQIGFHFHLKPNLLIREMGEYEIALSARKAQCYRSIRYINPSFAYRELW